MMRGLVVTGTDTDVGKTVVAAMLALGLGGSYWKPVQAGYEGGTDTEAVKAMTGLGPDRVLEEAYRLRTPCSPHAAAEIDGVRIDLAALDPAARITPRTSLPLIIEGAGGALVPLDRKTVYADLFAAWGWPAVLCARTSLGTINHSLMALEVLRARKVPVLGIVFVGAANEDSERTIAEMGNARRLGRLPMLGDLRPPALVRAFAENFRAEDFGGKP